MHGISGIIIECPVVIRSQNSLPNGAPRIDILLGQNVCRYPIGSSSSHINVRLSVLNLTMSKNGDVKKNEKPEIWRFLRPKGPIGVSLRAGPLHPYG